MQTIYQKLLLFILFLCGFSQVFCQLPGDTIVVESFTFLDNDRDILVDFPNDPLLTYEKILLRYTMRCKEGLVSTTAERNKGCGEWDYSCNTYLVDSSKVEIVPSQVTSHFLTNFNEDVFSYKQTPVYDYMREAQQSVTIDAINSENTAQVAPGTEPLAEVLNTAELAGKSQFLYTKEELENAGLVAGEIHGFSAQVLDNAGSAEFLRILMKNSSKTSMNDVIDLNGFTEVYYSSTNFIANEEKRFQFHTPFVWDGTSNILLEFNFSNLNTTTVATEFAGENTSEQLSMLSRTGSEFLLSGNTYLECLDYKGIGGSQNRTIETWIKGDVVRNGEICTYGLGALGEKWTFRLLNTGEIRVEISGTGTVSTTKINDGNWHHIACVLDGDNASDIRFYIDGVLDVNSATGNGEINTNITEGIHLRINRGLNNRYFDGELDDFRIWDTALSGETIQQWMRRDIDESHPNHANLQVHYEFDHVGTNIIDSSPYERNANIIGSNYRTAFADGNGLFKDFQSTYQRPSLTFLQGDYDLTVETIEVDRPFTKPNQIFVSENTIEVLTDEEPFHDLINSTDPLQHWTTEQLIYDGITGNYIESSFLDEDGTIEVTLLDYKRRFPFYNELISFVTPYGIGIDFGLEGESWMFDMTDYVHILQGQKRLIMTLGGQLQENMDLDFLFIVGTPPREVIVYDQLWQGTNRQGIANINQILDDTKFPPFIVEPVAEVQEYKLRSSITGHGSDGEFAQNGGSIIHRITVDGTLEYQWDITQECSMNPIYPQGGTWVTDRQGWCPGERTWIEENNMTEYLATNNAIEVDYSTSNPIDPSGDYRYHVAHQLIGYGPANHQLDAAVVEVLAPNNTAEYTRIGTVCANPQVRIQNTGSTELTELTIEYWLNNAMTPQSFSWTGNLAFMETEVVEIPSSQDLWMDVLDENNTFNVAISSPNQGADEYEFNNRFQSSIDIPIVIPEQFAVVVKTNNIPSQNSYQIINDQGEVVGANDLTNANNTSVDEYNLPKGCYKLLFYDSGQDGLQWWANPNQGSGYVTIIDLDAVELVEFNSDFGAGFEYSFTTDFMISHEEINFLTSIKAFPNPTTDLVQLQGIDLENTTIYVTDAVGTRVDPPINNQGNSISINLENSIAGMYFIHIEKAQLHTTRKVIKL